MKIDQTIQNLIQIQLQSSITTTTQLSEIIEFETGHIAIISFALLTKFNLTSPSQNSELFHHFVVQFCTENLPYFQFFNR